MNAMRNRIEEKEQKKITKEELKVLEKGYNMGKILVKSKAEIYADPPLIDLNAYDRAEVLEGDAK
jgi:hypothetical protein